MLSQTPVHKVMSVEHSHPQSTIESVSSGTSLWLSVLRRRSWFDSSWGSLFYIIWGGRYG